MRFGEQRLVREDVSGLHRALYQIMGVPDPAHYLHWRYFARALDSLPELRPRRILDAGCGGGDYSFYLARRFPDATIRAVDLDPDAIERCQLSQRKLDLRNLEFVVADLTQLAGDASYDLIVSIDVLEHITEQRRALTNLALSLRPGGYAFYHIPTARPKPVPLARWLHDFHEWGEHEHVAEEQTPTSFASRVSASGLQVVRHWHTFAYWTGELATSLFALGFRNSLPHRVGQALLAPAGRLLALADTLPVGGPRFATAVLARKPV